MNEKIKELAEQAGMGPWGIGNGYEPDGIVEKFAELIVGECAAYIDDNIGYDDCNNTYPVTGDVLKDHFGVKE